VKMEDALPVLSVADAAQSPAWYIRLGYAQEWEHRFEPTFPAFASIARNETSRFSLSEHRGDAKPNTLVSIRAHDLDVIAREFNVKV